MPSKRGDFECSVCGFRCRYDYFGREPPFEHAAVRRSVIGDRVGGSIWSSLDVRKAFNCF